MNKKVAIAVRFEPRSSRIPQADRGCTRPLGPNVKEFSRNHLLNLDCVVICSGVNEALAFKV